MSLVWTSGAFTDIVRMATPPSMSTNSFCGWSKFEDPPCHTTSPYCGPVFYVNPAAAYRICGFDGGNALTDFGYHGNGVQQYLNEGAGYTLTAGVWYGWAFRQNGTGATAGTVRLWNSSGSVLAGTYPGSGIDASALTANNLCWHSNAGGKVILGKSARFRGWTAHLTWDQLEAELRSATLVNATSNFANILGDSLTVSGWNVSASMTLDAADDPPTSFPTPPVSDTARKVEAVTSVAATTVVATLNSTAAGSLIVVGTTSWKATTGVTISVSDNVNGAYSQAFTQLHTTGGIRSSLHYFANNTGGNLTITVTASSTANMAMFVHEFAGVAASSVISGTPTTAQGSGTGPVTPAMTPADQNVLLVAVLSNDTATAITEDASNGGYTLSNDHEAFAGAQTGSMVFKITAGTVGIQSHMWTQSSSVWACGMAAFKGATVTAVRSRLTLLGVS